MPGLGMGKLAFKAQGAAAPTLDSVSRSQTQPIDCGQPWIVDASWTTTGNNDSLYQINVYAYPGTGSPVASGLTSASSSWSDDTGLVGDYTQFDYTHSRQYTIKLIRISDSVVLAQLDTTEITTNSGPSC